MSFTYNDIVNAEKRINKYLSPTPLVKSFYLNNYDKNVYFKLETMQVVKNFKIRGALNKILTLSKNEINQGIAAISSGNHGSSVAYIANLLDIKNCTIIVPETTPKSKIDMIKYYGAKILFMGKNYDEAHQLGMKYIENNNLIYIDSCHNDKDVYAGQGTIALEVLKQNPNIDCFIVPVSGGGLITGIALAAKTINKNIKIIGVQTEACPAMIKSFEDNIHYEYFESSESICDSLIGGIGALSFSMLRDLVDDLLLVSEESIKKAISFMVKKEKYIAEAGSATVIAALKENYEKINAKNICLVISGANIDGDLLSDILNKY